jgi:hypothetical protein
MQKKKKRIKVNYHIVDEIENVKSTSNYKMYDVKIKCNVLLIFK